jgi:hypothetical protein
MHYVRNCHACLVTKRSTECPRRHASCARQSIGYSYAMHSQSANGGGSQRLIQCGRCHPLTRRCRLVAHQYYSIVVLCHTECTHRHFSRRERQSRNHPHPSPIGHHPRLSHHRIEPGPVQPLSASAPSSLEAQAVGPAQHVLPPL